MSTALERTETNQKRGGWGGLYKLSYIKPVEPQFLPENKANQQLIDKINKYQPLNEPFPLWTEELTKGFNVLNEARLRYETLFPSSKANPESYSKKSKEKIEILLKNYEWVKGSHRGNVFTLNGLDANERLGDQKDPFEKIIEKCEDAREPLGRLVEHAKLWVTWILANQKVDFRSQEVKDLVARTAQDTAKTCLPDIFLKKLKERLIIRLQKPDSPAISFVDLKPDTMQEKIYPFIILGWSNFRIAKELQLKRKQIVRAKIDLKKRNILPEMLREERMIQMKIWRK
ncbi:MAG: hypothetical protein Q7K55_03415 [Candidatus Levybacteria bacterium]|nr:hypothetical protein [Candidatus Levybacteria bacterium]